MFEFIKSKKINRQDLILILEDFKNSYKQYEVFDIPDELYIEYLTKLENKLKLVDTTSDKRFVTYGRLDFLRHELTDRLNDKELSKPSPNWKEKWDNRLGAFWDLYDYVIGDRHISISEIAKNNLSKDVILMNDNYYKDGNICLEEKNIILDMIKELKDFIKNNRKDDNMGLFNNKNKYDIEPEDNVPQKVYGVPFIKPSLKGQKVRISLENSKSKNYVMTISTFDGKMANISFADMKNLNNKSISDISTQIPMNLYDKFMSKINEITKNWKDKYETYSELKLDVKWSIKISDDNDSRNIEGEGAVPNNWKEFMNLVVEYELLFKQKKEQDIKTINEMNSKDKSFEEIVKGQFKDPFWSEVVIRYFKDELKENDTASKIIFEDIRKYEDILKEFTKYLIQKTYDLDNRLEINGYTAKKIAELNPSFEACGVYSFMKTLRDKPDDALKIINNGFPNKDVVSPVKVKESYLKLEHTPFHGCYGRIEDLNAQKVKPIVSYHKIVKGQSLVLDKINVIVDDLTDEKVCLTIPYQSGIIVNRDDYIKKQPTKVILKLEEKCEIHLDVFDAMESWEISFVDSSDNS